MKNYEKFNEVFEENLNVYEHSLEMIIGLIESEYNINLGNTKSYVKIFNENITWLNKELKEI